MRDNYCDDQNDTRVIPLSRGMSTVVDAADYEFLTQWGWRSSGKTRIYAVRRIERSPVSMHRLLMAPPAGMLVDHINGDGLDNRRANLRVTTWASNIQRAGGRVGRSGYRGVHLNNEGPRWCAHIRIKGQMRHLGVFDTPEEAAAVYDAAAIALHGPHAYTNKGAGLL